MINGSCRAGPDELRRLGHGSTQDGDTSDPDDLIGWNFAAQHQ